jgi:hypothetical protein
MDKLSFLRSDSAVSHGDHEGNQPWNDGDKENSKVERQGGMFLMMALS